MRYTSSIGLVFTICATRLLPHPPNFTPALAVLMLAPFLFRSRAFGLLAPLVGLVVSDLILGFHWVSLFVYVSYLVVGLLGQVLVARANLSRLVGGLALGVASFFVISNFGVWFLSSMYPHTVEGLMQCYIAAVPFLGNLISGTFLYAAIMIVLGQALSQKDQRPYKGVLAL